MRRAKRAGVGLVRWVVALLLLPTSALAQSDVFETLRLANPLVTPRDVAVDRFGNVYVLGARSGNVFQIGPQGLVREIFDPADEGMAGRVDGLHALAVDSAGVVYVTASGTDNALRVLPRPAAELIGAYADGTGGPLRAPTAITTDPASRDVYVAGSGSSNVFRITPSGRIEEILDPRGDGSKACVRPVDLAVDGSSNVFIACEGTSNVFRVTPSGRVREVLGERSSLRTPVDRPRHLGTDSAGNLYVGGASGLFRVAPSGEAAAIVRVGSGLPFGAIAGLAVAATDAVYVSLPREHRVVRIARNGAIHEIANGAGDGTYPLESPDALAIDASGNVYVAGAGSDNVFLISPDGAVRQILDVTGDQSWIHQRGLQRGWPRLNR